MTQVQAPSTAPAAPGRRRAGSKADPLAWALALLVPVVVVGLYLARYPPHGLDARLSRGWDIFAYVWQTRALGHTSLAFIGTRPGTPVLSALLRSVVRADPMQQLVVLPPLLVAAMALAAGTVVRMAFRLPAWTVAAMAIVVSLWPSTSEFVVGYQANLLMLALVASGVGFLIHAQGRPRALAAAVVLFTAAALTHIAIYAVFVVVAGLAVVLAVPAFIRDRRAGRPVLATEAGATVGAVGPGALLGGGALFGALGLSPSDALHAETVSVYFKSNTVNEVHFIRPKITLPIALVGMATAWGSRGGRPAAALRRLGFAWLAVCAAGTAAPYFGFAVPGARFVLFALPLPLMVGLGMATLGLVMVHDPARWRVVLAAVLVLAGVIGLASPRVRAMYHAVNPKPQAVWDQLAAANRYVERLPVDRQVVFVADLPGQYGAFTPKRTTYMARSTVPPDAIDRTFVYMGGFENLQRRRPTLIAHPQHPWERSYNTLSLTLWKEAEPALRSGAAVLVVQGFAGPDFETLINRDPRREIAPGLYVLEGPVIPVGATARPEPAGYPEGGAVAAAYLVVLGLLGWGLVSWGLGGVDATRLDRLCLAPAAGAGVGVIAGFVLAAFGGDPSGVAGLVVLVAAAAGGFQLMRMTRDAPSPQD